jgi:hypothetical protein
MDKMLRKSAELVLYREKVVVSINRKKEKFDACRARGLPIL